MHNYSLNSTKLKGSCILWEKEEERGEKGRRGKERVKRKKQGEEERVKECEEGWWGTRWEGGGGSNGDMWWVVVAPSNFLSPN